MTLAHAQAAAAAAEEKSKQPTEHQAEGRELPAGAAFDAVLMRRLLEYMRPQKRLLFWGLGLLILAGVLRLAGPWLVMLAIDDHLSLGGESPGSTGLSGGLPGGVSGFMLLAGAYLGLAAFEAVVRRYQMLFVETAGQNTLFDLRLAVFSHLQRLSSRFFDTTPIGRLVGRVTTDVEALQEMFSSGVVTILGDLFFLIATVVVLLVLQWKLALLTFLIVPVLIGLTLVMRVRVRKAYAEMRRRMSQLNAYLHEQIAGIAVIQSFLGEARSARSYREINDELCEQQISSVRWESVLSALMEMLGSLAIALILWYGGGVVIDSRGNSAGFEALTLGALFAFVDYMQRFFQPLNELSLKYTVMQNAMTSSNRIFNLLDREEVLPEPDAKAAKRVPQDVLGEVEFRDVHFAYDEQNPVLHGVSFKVTPGEKLALVGATGAGKSSILKLLTRLYDVTSGSVLLDGVDVRDYPQRDLRLRMGIVSQDVFLFEGDLLSNICLERKAVSPERGRQAAAELGLDEIVKRFPNGYAEPVRERGKNLSAGEKQLLSFARALAMQPKVLLLDEATANVDTKTEQLLQAALARLTEKRTSIIVAHRLSTIRDADRILVLDHGRLVEQGSHDELMQRGGAYWQLYREQFEGEL